MNDTVTVTFDIVSGESKTFTDVEITHPNAALALGSTVEILHSSGNWEGTYEIIRRTEVPPSKTANTHIRYTLILTKVQLWHTTQGHYKRWIGEMGGKEPSVGVVCSWGKINGALQSITKKFRTKGSASAFLREKMEEKLKKGYRLK